MNAKAIAIDGKQPHQRKNAWLLLVAVALVAIVGTTSATTLDPVSANQLVDYAELIFQGVVKSVEYRNSDVASANHVSLPHTFVTFQIERAFKGSAQNGSFITLRFQGGPDGTGRALMIPGVPRFDVEDRDILFVRGNGTQIAPLVGWEQGRFRIVNDAVYSDAGEEVWLTPAGKFTLGKQHALEEVVTHNLGSVTIKYGIKDEKQNWIPPIGAKHLNAEGLASFVTEKVKQLPTGGRLAAEILEPSVYIQDKFYVVKPQRRAPRSLPAASATAQPIGTAGISDPFEEEMLQKNGGNPVLDAPNP